MSWDLILLKDRYDTDDPESLPPPLGPRDRILTQLCALLPGLDYSDKSWGILRADDIFIEFNTGNDEIVDSIVLHIRSGEDPMKVVRAIAHHMDWSVIDGADGSFMDFDDQHSNWKLFEAWREEVLALEE